MACTAAPVGEVTMPMRRGTAGSAAALGGKQSFRGELCFQLFELALERAFACLFEVFDSS